MTSLIDPIRRNLKFGLPKDKALSWNPSGLHVAQFYNTLSIFFPAGERFFIQSVRNYRNEITDEKLKAQVSAFIGQEGFHTREHEEYNDALAQAGMPIEELDKLVVIVLDTVKKLPPAAQLSVTVALEHLTAVLGDTLLRDDDLLEGADPHFAAIWQWHALEETEHKAVCFDAYEQVVGTGVSAYALRVFAFSMANIIFWSLYAPFYVRMLSRSGGLFNLKGWGKLANFVAGKPGVLRRIAPEWLDFFRPGFHPWMHDNKHYLERADALVKEVKGFQIKAVEAA
ncbi:MAG: metal-dependent hydrolase [Pseudomonadales bacterium]|nr:metal-dependent hydrolase [Pseudomonadales bacterium]RLU03469.1 MAG: metal-dependent hydrolase [Ketobacter sp.]